jgi:hypothetical protein
MLQAHGTPQLEALASATAVNQVPAAAGHRQLRVHPEQQRQLVRAAAFVLLRQVQRGR